LEVRNEERPDDLLTAGQAAAIISKNSGHPVSADYVRMLAGPRYRKLHAIHIDNSTNLYRRAEVEAIRVDNRPGRKRRAGGGTASDP